MFDKNSVCDKCCRMPFCVARYPLGSGVARGQPNGGGGRLLRSVIVCLPRRANRSKLAFGEHHANRQDSIFNMVEELMDGYCCICLGRLKLPGLSRQTLSCGHVFHERCVPEM